MVTTIDAVYEGGVLRPVEPVDLDEGARVRLVVVPEVRRGKKSLTQILDEIAGLPIEGVTDPFSGEDHDKVLYPEEGQV